MAKGKKATGRNQTSAGSMKSIDPRVVKAVRRERHYADVMLAKLDAWKKRKRFYVTVENPNKNETNKRFVRVLGSSWMGHDYGKYTSAEA